MYMYICICIYVYVWPGITHACVTPLLDNSFDPVLAENWLFDCIQQCVA